MNARVLLVDEAGYHADPCPEPSLSSTGAKELVDRSPRHAHAIHPKLGGKRRASTPTFDRGRLIHRLLLDDGAEIEIVEAKDWKTKKARESREAAIALGKIPVLAYAYDDAARAAEQLTRGLGDHGVDLQDGERELPIAWQETTRHGPIWCRSMLDCVFLPRGIIYDVKSTENAHPDVCARHVLTYGYDIQRAAYVRALEQLHPELAGLVEFRLVFVELEPPYAMTIAELDGVLREHGERRWKRAVESWGECLSKNFWPAWPVVHRLEAPGWLLARMEEA